MIVTLTANPALDRTITLPAPLAPGEVQAATSSREDAGGKGINVARVIAAASSPVVAVLPLADDDPYRVPLEAAGVPTRAVPVARPVRANLALTDQDGVTTKINLPGVALSTDDVAALTDAVVAASEGATWLVLAGSLPDALADTFYVDVARAVRARWGAQAPKIAVDTSGPALRQVVAHGAPDLIKPNDDELAEFTGAALDPADPAGVAEAVARTIVPAQVASALVTLGSAGAVLVTANGAWFCPAPRIRVASTVGAGDSSLAGYLLADVAGGAPEDRLLSAIRYGAAAASLPGTQVPSPADLGGESLTVRSL